MEEYKTKTIGVVGVDSGQVLLIDPCYIKKDSLGNEEFNYDNDNKKYLNDPTLDNKKNFYTNVCERTLIGEGYGNVMSGFATRTTHGDGNYEVKGIFNDEEQLQGIFISFVDDIQAEFKQEDTDDNWFE
jgi:hypothetical protein